MCWLRAYLDLEQIRAGPGRDTSDKLRLLSSLSRNIVDSQWIWKNQGLGVGERLDVERVWSHFGLRIYCRNEGVDVEEKRCRCSRVKCC